MSVSAMLVLLCLPFGIECGAAHHVSHMRSKQGRLWIGNRAMMADSSMCY